MSQAYWNARVLAPIWGDISHALTTWQFDLVVIAALVVAIVVNRVLPTSGRAGLPTDLAIIAGLTVAIGWGVLQTLGDHAAKAAYAHFMGWVTVGAVAAVVLVWIIRARGTPRTEAMNGCCLAGRRSDGHVTFLRALLGFSRVLFFRRTRCGRVGP